MNFDLRPHTILLTVAGSRAYGLDRPDSDVDLKGVAVPPAAWFHGFLREFEQAEDVSDFRGVLTPGEAAVVDRTRLEGVVYDIRKFFGLATACNPNILDVLFCRDEEVRVTSAAGARLRAHRALFVSGAARHTFGGYAAAQLKRIRGHRKWLLDPPTHPPTRGEFGLPEHTLLPADQVNAVNAGVDKVLGGLGQSADEATWLAAARRFGLDDNLVYVMVQERAYASAARHYRQFETWRKSRNPARAAAEAKFGYDTKHAAHLVRLLRMATEILATGEVRVWRADREELLAVRDGAWPYDALVGWAEQQDAELETLLRSGPIAVPAQPDREAIDRLCVELVEQVLASRER